MLKLIAGWMLLSMSNGVASQDGEGIVIAGNWFQCLNRAAREVPESVTPEGGVSRVREACSTQYRLYHDHMETLARALPPPQRAAALQRTRAEMAALPTAIANEIRAVRRSRAVQSAAAAAAASSAEAALAAQTALRTLIIGKWRQSDSTCELGLNFAPNGTVTLGRRNRNWSVISGPRLVVGDTGMTVQVVSTNHIVLQSSPGTEIIMHRCPM